jgi:hypothetical protein
MILALKQRDRIRRVHVLVPDGRMFTMAMEEEYLILECLLLWHRQQMMRTGCH